MGVKVPPKQGLSVWRYWTKFITKTITVLQRGVKTVLGLSVPRAEVRAQCYEESPYFIDFLAHPHPQHKDQEPSFSFPTLRSILSSNRFASSLFRPPKISSIIENSPCKTAIFHIILTLSISHYP